MLRGRGKRRRFHTVAVGHNFAGLITDSSKMKSFENSFIHGSSPTYADEVVSENGKLTVLPIEKMLDSDRYRHQSPFGGDTFMNEKFKYSCATDTSPYLTNLKPLKQGRKTFAFWTVAILSLVLTIGNLILTLTIIGVLHLGKGIHGMELIPEVDVIKFYGSTDLDRIYSKMIGQIEGFSDVPVTINTENDGSVYVRLQRNGLSHNRLSMDRSGILLRSVNTFEVKDPNSGATIFTTHRPQYNMPAGAESLVAKAVSASRIASPLHQPLLMEADGKASIKGSEGIFLDAASAFLRAEHNLVINTTQGATILGAGAGVYIDMGKVPVVSSEFGLRTGSVQYKICVCMPQGTLFRIAIPRIHNGPKISCAHFNGKYDPCM